MKVLHFLDSVNRGGAETIALDVCRNAARFGIELTVVTTKGGTMIDDFAASGAEFIKLERRFPVDFKLIKNLRQIIKERDIKITQGYQAVECLHLYLAAQKLKNVRVVMSHQGFITGKKNHLTARFLAPRIDANINVSKGLLPWLETELGIDTRKNFHLIYNCADERRLAPSGALIKKELGLDENNLLLGMVANFHAAPTKDPLTVCRALQKVFAENKNSHFVFVGKVMAGGEKRFEECRRFCRANGIGERVHFLGGRTDVADILNELDLFVFSSLAEGLPISIAEAMLTKTPVIASNIPPLVEASGEGEYAEIFRVKDADDLAEKILKLLDDKNLRENLAEKAYSFARENYSIEAHLKKLKTLYEKLLNE
jgi:L-malate glycosyltransferase